MGVIKPYKIRSYQKSKLIALTQRLYWDVIEQEEGGFEKILKKKEEIRKKKVSEYNAGGVT